jgi:hypothetical protein
MNALDDEEPVEVLDDVPALAELAPVDPVVPPVLDDAAAADDPPPDTVSPTVPLRTVIVPENGAVSVAPASALVSCVTVDWA